MPIVMWSNGLAFLAVSIPLWFSDLFCTPSRKSGWFKWTQEAALYSESDSWPILMSCVSADWQLLFTFPNSSLPNLIWRCWGLNLGPSNKACGLPLRWAAGKEQAYFSSILKYFMYVLYMCSKETSMDRGPEEGETKDRHVPLFLVQVFCFVLFFGTWCWCHFFFFQKLCGFICLRHGWSAKVEMWDQK